MICRYSSYGLKTVTAFPLGMCCMTIPLYLNLNMVCLYLRYIKFKMYQHETLSNLINTSITIIWKVTNHYLKCNAKLLFETQSLCTIYVLASSYYMSILFLVFHQTFTISTFLIFFQDTVQSSIFFILKQQRKGSNQLCNITNLNTDLIYLTARPKSAMAHWPFLFTRIFLLLMSRCDIAGLPRVPKISVWRCATPLAAERARVRRDEGSSTCVWR